MAYDSYGSFTKIQLVHLGKSRSHITSNKFTPDVHIADFTLFPLLIIFLMTSGYWIANRSFVKYVDIRFKYVFLKSRKQTTKALTLFHPDYSYLYSFDLHLLLEFPRNLHMI